MRELILPFDPLKILLLSLGAQNTKKGLSSFPQLNCGTTLIWKFVNLIQFALLRERKLIITMLQSIFLPFDCALDRYSFVIYCRLRLDACGFTLLSF